MTPRSQRALWVLLGVGVYLEPLVIWQLGARCPDHTAEASDLLGSLLLPLRLALRDNTPLAAVLLTLDCVGFWALALWAADRVRRGRWPVARLHLRALAGFCLLSAGLHLLLCVHDAGPAAPLGTGLPALDALLTPTAPLPNAWFAPRLAWAALLLRELRLPLRQGGLILLASLLLTLALRHLDVRDWLFTLLVAHVSPRAAAAEPPRRARRVTLPNDKDTFVIGPDDDDLDLLSSSSSSSDNDEDDGRRSPPSRSGAAHPSPTAAAKQATDAPASTTAAATPAVELSA